MSDYNFDSVLEYLYEGVYVVDINRKIIFWNDGSEKITGYKRNEVMNNHCFNNILQHVDKNGKKLCFDGCPLHNTLDTGNINESEVFLHHKDGHRVPVTVKSIPLRNPDGEIFAAIEVFTDTRFKEDNYQENRKLKEMLTIDTLTKIHNRRYLDFYLANMVKEYQEFSVPFGVLFFDIDHFKYVNDTYGHNVGDQVLQVLANTLKSNIRNNDIVGRWGGEEFIAVVRVESNSDLELIAEKLRRLVHESTFLTESKDHIQVTISIGGTLFQKQDTIQSIIERADELMYQSKENGRDQTTIK